MIEIKISKCEDKDSSSKMFDIENGKIGILHDMENGNDIVRVTINDKVEFEYDVNNPDSEIVGYFTNTEKRPEGSVIESNEILSEYGRRVRP